MPWSIHDQILLMQWRFMTNLGKQHWKTVKWILRCLQGTINKCLFFKSDELTLQGFVDSDFTGETDHKRSTIGYVFTIGTTVVSWVLQK